MTARRLHRLQFPVLVGGGTRPGPLSTRDRLVLRTGMGLLRPLASSNRSVVVLPERLVGLFAATADLPAGWFLRPPSRKVHSSDRNCGSGNVGERWVPGVFRSEEPCSSWSLPGSLRALFHGFHSGASLHGYDVARTHLCQQKSHLYG